MYQFILSIPEDESPNVPYTNNRYSHFSGGFVVLAPVCIFLNAHEIEQIFVGLLDTGCFPLRVATEDFAHFSLFFSSINNSTLDILTIL